jgi:hypothetical protein
VIGGAQGNELLRKADRALEGIELVEGMEAQVASLRGSLDIAEINLNEQNYLDAAVTVVSEAAVAILESDDPIAEHEKLDAQLAKFQDKAPTPRMAARILEYRDGLRSRLERTTDRAFKAAQDEAIWRIVSDSIAGDESLTMQEVIRITEGMPPARRTTVILNWAEDQRARAVSTSVPEPQQRVREALQTLRPVCLT